MAKLTKSTPFGSVDTPFNPVSLTLGAEATFVARTHDMDRAHMQETFRRAHQHNGAAFVEVLQNCNVFNDGAFEKITSRDVRANMLIPLQHGQPIVFGAEGEERGVIQCPDGSLEIVSVAEVGLDALLVHDEERDDPGLASALPRLTTAPTSRPRSGSSGPSSAPSTARRCPSRSPPHRASAGWATWRPCSAPVRAGRSTRPTPHPTG